MVASVKATSCTGDGSLKIHLPDSAQGHRKANTEIGEEAIQFWEKLHPSLLRLENLPKVILSNANDAREWKVLIP